MDKIDEYQIQDEYTESVKEYYIKNNRITDRQAQCLQNRINRYEQIKQIMDELDKKENIQMKTNFNSVKEFFNERKYLSNKQLELLKIIQKLNIN
jgi:glutathionyl-hydroquinone reductase